MKFYLMDNSSPWYQIKNVDQIDSPALVLFPERVKDNIRYLKSCVKDTALLRPHVKTHKMLEVAHLMIQEGIHKFKCATIAEAEMLAMSGAKHVLLAYQPVGPKIFRLLQLVKSYPQTRFACLVDNMMQAQSIGAIFGNENLVIEVFVDLNVGMDRTGIPPGDAAKDLYIGMDQITGIKPMGLHVYDGHIRELDFMMRKQKCDEAFMAVTDLVKSLEEAGQSRPIVVAGGSPTFPIHAERGDVECSPGTFIFWDWGYHKGLPEQNFKIAALVVSRIISIIDKNLLCVDLGHKAIASENPSPRVHFLNLPDALEVSHSEEHLVLQVDDTKAYSLGDILYGVPYHICPTCALYEYSYVVDNKEVVDKWKVLSRNRSIKF